MTDSTPFDFSVVDGRATVSGEVDHATAPLLERWLRSLAGEPLHIDLRRVTFLDSAGLRALVTARRHNPKMRVTETSSAIAKLFEVSGLVDYLVGGRDLAEPQ